MTTPLEALAGTANASEPLPGLVVSGQPSARHFEALQAAGVRTVVDLRDPMEPRPLDEPAVLAALGMKYVSIPVTAGNLDTPTLERILAELRDRGDQPLLVHCASGNRVGAATIAHLMLDHGVTEDEAVQAAMKHGLRGAEILQWGLDYVASQRP